VTMVVPAPADRRNPSTSNGGDGVTFMMIRVHYRTAVNGAVHMRQARAVPD
jgi:hypothetical protein